MSIKIIKEPNIHITAGELARYRAAYEAAMRFYAGPPITLEEWIRSHSHDEALRKPTP